MRYFVPATPEESLPTLRAPLLAHLVDVVRLPWGASEAVVVRDRGGAIHLLVDDVPACLPAELRQALAHHELARGKPARRLDAASLSILLIERVEQAMDTPGLDDPLQLHGRLYGPFGDAAPPVVTTGTLTVTRGDLLHGLCAGAPDALMATGLGGRPARCLHALVAGDTPDATRAGRGLVLAYALCPAEIGPPDAANEALVAEILEDVLTALQADLRAAGQDSAFAKRVLPVASRADVEAELEREGWEIQGNSAVRLHGALKTGLGSLLTNVLGVPDNMKRPLPREASADEFLAIAQEALGSLPGWLGERGRALQAAHSVVTQAPTPAPSGLPRPPAQPRPKSPRGARAPRAPAPVDWHADFGVPVRRTTELHRKRSASSPSRPTWMDDFE